MNGKHPAFILFKGNFCEKDGWLTASSYSKIGQCVHARLCFPTETLMCQNQDIPSYCQIPIIPVMIDFAQEVLGCQLADSHT